MDEEKARSIVIGSAVLAVVVAVAIGFILLGFGVSVLSTIGLVIMAWISFWFVFIFIGKLANG